MRTPPAKLLHVMSKHRDSLFRKPVSAHTQIAFDSVREILKEGKASGRPCMLDSCCGTATSTCIIAEQHPDALVIGIDRSAHRLNAARVLPSNAILLRAECADFWRLCMNARLVFSEHTIFYPNPYPKSEHLTRRWHAHPAFPAMLAISRGITVRTNMQWYVDEMSVVLSAMGHPASVSALDICLPDNSSIHYRSAFEKKYAERGDQLWQLRCEISERIHGVR